MTVASESQRLIDSKAAIKLAIEAKGISVGSVTIDAYAAKIAEIATGTDISDADAVAADVVASKTFYATSGGKKTGIMPNNGTVNTDLSTKAQQVIIAAGKHSGNGIVQIAAAEQAKIIPEYILKDKTILGVTGIVEPIPPTYYTVRFIDGFGTILKTQLVISGQNATAPSDPSIPLLTFMGWNRTFTNVTSNIDVGAMYKTTTGHSYLFITLNAATGSSPVICLNKSSSATLNIYNNDSGVLLGTSSAGGNISLTLAIATTGNFTLRIECTGLYTFGNGTTATSIFKNGTYTSILTKIYTGNTVTAIGNSAFQTCTSLSVVVLSTYVQTIGVSAFQYTNLKHFVFTTTVSSMGSQMFQSCYSMLIVSFSSTINAIGNYAFYFCTSLPSVTIPAAVTTIGNYAFYQCPALKTVVIPNLVTTIGTNAFYNCVSLSSINIPSSVTTIGDSAFSSCTALQIIILPNSVTSLGTSVFWGCGFLTSAVLSTALTSIPDYTFYQCYNLTSVTFSSSVTSIGTYAFYGCFSMTFIALPASLTSIASYAFYACYAMTQVEIPSLVNSIGAGAFANLNFLTKVIVNRATPATLGDNTVFSGLTGICRIEVPPANVATYKAATNWLTWANNIVSQ